MRKREQSTRADVWLGLELLKGIESPGGELALVRIRESLLGTQLFVLGVLCFIAMCVHKRVVHKGKKNALAVKNVDVEPCSNSVILQEFNIRGLVMLVLQPAH